MTSVPFIVIARLSEPDSMDSLPTKPKVETCVVVTTLPPESEVGARLVTGYYRCITLGVSRAVWPCLGRLPGGADTLA